jgi:hypothetical protein
MRGARPYISLSAWSERTRERGRTKVRRISARRGEEEARTTYLSERAGVSERDGGRDERMDS